MIVTALGLLAFIVADVLIWRWITQQDPRKKWWQR